MLVATLMVHASNGFFMNWAGNQKGEGFEYHLLAVGLALIVIVAGGGKWSVDSWFGGSSTQKSNSNTSKETSANLAVAALVAKRKSLKNYFAFIRGPPP